MADKKTNDEFPLADARKLILNLAKPKPIRYWLDFLTFAAVGWTAFVLTLTLQVPTIAKAGLALVSSLSLYRCMIFIHELAHVRRGGLNGFRVIWNLLCGFPVMLPSFTYRGVHNEHHIRKVYGTQEDGEYFAFVWDKPYKILGFPIISLILPIYFFIRFTLLTPFLVLSKKLRKFVWSWFSSLAIILKYKRPLPESKKEEKGWLVQEWFACIYGITAIVLIAVGVIPYTALILWYGITALGFVLNAFRTLAAHAYRNPGDQVMSQSEQFLDSVNVPGFLFFPALWAPVGLRYHATHHLFPLMPYHALGKAHRVLKKELPKDSLYHNTYRKTLLHAIVQLWKETAA